MAGSVPRLTYFSGRGFSETIRLAFSAAGIPYEDVYLETRDDFLQLIKDGKLLFKQVPLLEVDGRNLIGAGPILRYVCRRGNLEGKTDDDKTTVDMLAMGAKDMLWPNLLNAKFEEVMDCKEKGEEVLKKGLKESRERYLPVFEKILADSKSGFLVGDSLTMADFEFFNAICQIHERPDHKHELDIFPHCKAFIAHFSEQPGIKAYLASPRRTPLTTREHAIDVCRILGMLP